MVFIVHLLPMYIYLASFQMEPFFLFARSFFHVARTKVKCWCVKMWSSDTPTLSIGSSFFPVQPSEVMELLCACVCANIEVGRCIEWSGEWGWTGCQGGPGVGVGVATCTHHQLKLNQQQQQQQQGHRQHRDAVHLCACASICVSLLTFTLCILRL